MKGYNQEDAQQGLRVREKLPAKCEGCPRGTKRSRSIRRLRGPPLREEEGASGTRVCIGEA